MLRVFAVFLALAFLGMAIIKYVMTNSWFPIFATMIIVIPLFMYALKGNNWLKDSRYKYISLFRNINKKNDGNDYYNSIDFNWFKNIFKHKNKNINGD